MAYHKNKEEAFQAAQQASKKANDQSELVQLIKASGNYGQELAHLKEEINEAYQQIQKAQEVASEHQKDQLYQFESDLISIVNEVNETDNRFLKKQ